LKFILTASTKQPWTYDKTKMRLFRWYSDPANPAAGANWLEYSDAQADKFALSQGMVIWAKSLAPVDIDFGPGVTTSLRQSYSVTLAAKSFTDIALPYRFNVRMGDILDSNATAIDSALMFYGWSDSSGTDITSLVFSDALNTSATLNLADPTATISSLDLTAYTVYNPTAAPISLRIPPIPAAASAYGALSKRGVAKGNSSTGAGWAIAVESNLNTGARLGTVYCAFAQSKNSPSTSYFPVPPSFAQQYAGVYSDAERKVRGHALVRGVAAGGYSFTLAFVNNGSDASAISYRLSNLISLPAGVAARVFDEKTGANENASGGVLRVSVPAGSTEYKVLAVGNTAFLAKMALSLQGATLKFLGVSPNPFGSTVHIRYSVPEQGIGVIRFAIFDLRGRTVWEKAIDARGAQGVHELVWDGRTAGGRSVASGAYVVQMYALDERNKSVGAFEKKITFMPLSGR
jgi:hypothetical protein